MHIKTAPLRLMSSLILALSSAHLYATTWKLDDVVARHVEQTTPYFFMLEKVKAGRMSSSAVSSMYRVAVR